MRFNCPGIPSSTHNQLPDQLIKHMPEMEFITFIGNFGGLLGLWLGFSIYAIIKLFSKYVNLSYN
jgi:hypothetical protein